MRTKRLPGMPCLLVIVVLSGFLLAGCASRPPATAPSQPSDFETPLMLRASEILPPELYKGPHHVVDEPVVTDGWNNHYTITSDFGLFTASGEEMLRLRVQEIQILAALREIKMSTAFAEAAANTVTYSIGAVRDLILHPVDTLIGIPKGAWRYFTRIGRITGGGQSAREESVVKELMGFAAVKRQLASQLGADVYSSNATLQRELNSVAWAAYAGGMGVKAALSFLPDSIVLDVV